MPTIGEIAQGAQAAEAPATVPAVEAVETGAAEAPAVAPGVNLSTWLLSPTGRGALSEYLDHPLNWDKQEDTGQIIRGLTGLFDRLDLALIDIIIGALRKTWRRAQRAKPETGQASA